MIITVGGREIGREFSGELLEEMAYSHIENMPVILIVNQDL
jgi:hypothetical protein